MINLFLILLTLIKHISSLQPNYFYGLNLVGFDEIVFVTDSLFLEHGKYEVKARRNEIAVWRPQEQQQFYRSRSRNDLPAANSLLVGTPHNFSALMHHIYNIAEFYKRRQDGSASPFFLIILPNAELNQNALELDFITATLAKEFQLDSNVFFASSYRKTNSYRTKIGAPKIREVYSLGNNTIFEEIGSRQSLFNQMLSKSTRRANLRRHVVSCTAQNDPDYHLESEFKYVDGTWEMVGGLSVEILRDLETALNFTPKIVPGEGWMNIAQNGSWIGMGRQVFDKEVDISFSQSIFMVERSAAFTFLHPTHYGSVAAFFKQPRSSYFRNIYKHAFDSGLWLISCAFWLIAAVVIVIIHKITMLATGVADVNDEELSRNSLLWAIGTPCQQGWYQDPKSRSLKIVFISGSICALISYIGFSGGLVSILSTEVEPIRTVGDLLTSPLKLLTDAFVPFIDDILEHEIDSMEQSIDPSKFSRGFSTAVTADVAVKEILLKPSAFLTLPDGFMTVYRRNYTDLHFCESLSSIRVAGKPHPTGMFIRKGSPYKEIFNQKIIVTYERGLNSRSRKRYVFETTAHCSHTRVNYRGGLDLRDVYSAFAILLGGFCICSAVGIIEYLEHRFRIFRSRNYFAGPVVN